MHQDWELVLLDADPKGAVTLASLAAGDLDGDGRLELVTGGEGALLWYRPATGERGRIALGTFGVGLALADLDGDGRLEVVTAEETEGVQQVVWFDAEAGLGRPWSRHLIDPAADGSAHDLVFADLEGNGQRELVANAAYSARPGLFLYRPGPDPRDRWIKHTVDRGYFAEGLAVGDLDGDGRMDLVHGPYVYLQPDDGPHAGLWPRTVYAPGFREMCRTALVDLTGSGRLDVVVAESEYMDGRLSWFENRLRQDRCGPWVEHEIDRGWVYAHSLQAWTEEDRGCIFVAEMAAGGWHAPRNWEARVTVLTTTDQGATWQSEPVDRGQGTHQAIVEDVDGDGRREVAGKQWQVPAVQVWRQSATPSRPVRFTHRLLDRDKPYTALDILAADVDGDGLNDVVCGDWWYRNPDWRRYAIPGIHQVVATADLDGDGRAALIATKQRDGASSGYDGLTSELVWLRPIDPRQGRWEEHRIGTGRGDWPHGALVAPVLPGGRQALLVGYHNAADDGACPELFEIPADPTAPWPRRPLAEIPYGEELVACDLEGNGRLDLVAGRWWLENLGDGRFTPHLLSEQLGEVARARVADLDGDGRLEVLFVEEKLDFGTRTAGLAPVGYLARSGDVRRPWSLHVIDKVRSPHSLDVADLDGDGVPEVIAGEHDPFWPYRTRSRLLVYKAVGGPGRGWTRKVVDDRFEHHDGTKVIELGNGRLGVMSHGWTDSRYVHLWEVER